MTFVVPKVVDVIVGQGQELPLLTRGLIGLSYFVTHWGWLALVIFGAAIVGVRDALRNERCDCAGIVDCCTCRCSDA